MSNTHCAKLSSPDDFPELVDLLDVLLRCRFVEQGDENLEVCCGRVGIARLRSGRRTAWVLNRAFPSRLLNSRHVALTENATARRLREAAVVHDSAHSDFRCPCYLKNIIRVKLLSTDSFLSGRVQSN